MSYRVVVSQNIHPDAVGVLRSAGLEVVELGASAPAPRHVLERALVNADALVCLLTDRVDAGILSVASTLRVVANVAAGHDNIDVAAAKRAGVAVTNTPDVLTAATADLTMALLLAVARRVPEGDAHVRAGLYTEWTLEPPQTGLDVSGAAIGIVGLGRIGQAVARRAARGFDMPVVYAARRPAPAGLEREFGARRLPVDELLETSDFVTLHVPLTPQTRHLIDAAALARMKPTAVLVNTSRGALVDEAALVRALRDGVIAGAGLDVYEDEPRVHPGLLEQHRQVVLLPHIGSATRRTRRAMAMFAATSVVDVLVGRSTAHVVNPLFSAPASRPGPRGGGTGEGVRQAALPGLDRHGKRHGQR